MAVWSFQVDPIGCVRGVPPRELRFFPQVPVAWLQDGLGCDFWASADLAPGRKRSLRTRGVPGEASDLAAYDCVSPSAYEEPDVCVSEAQDGRRCLDNLQLWGLCGSATSYGKPTRLVRLRPPWTHIRAPLLGQGSHQKSSSPIHRATAATLELYAISD